MAGETQVYDGVNILMKVGSGSAVAILGETDGKVTVKTDMIANTHKGTSAGTKAFSPGRSELSFEASGAVYVGGTLGIVSLMATQLAGTELDFEADIDGDTVACKVYIEESSVQGKDSDQPTFALKGRSSGGDSITATPQ
jgi:hypothetical protein